MNQDKNLELEQLKLRNKYQQINYGSYHTSSEEEGPSYWSFLKLRIGFSLILLFFIVASSKALNSSETKKVQTIIRQMDQRDPYTQKVLHQLKTYIKERE